MAYTSTDLANVEAAIRAIIAGTRAVSFTLGDKSFTYTAADIKTLQALRSDIKAEVGVAAGTCSPRTYARQGGRSA